ncbi:MarR family winged helix-turn-helix transcriptional regulator [Actinoplanes teichomyceticus]|uniref:DNA-binding MarR family transcriptional regulator n=1 Tax=Actinoplanes teichomyceticus TaxID=1867 RepID=A0A561WLX8_ACTTI|nr:MarR family transcriptional regulator [Actinoplanes teichomyceticus]TWG24843.1 DNA-binding MarR family transcriptional regulator [Actinoplanes teichomyceticus]
MVQVPGTQRADVRRSAAGHRPGPGDERPPAARQPRQRCAAPPDGAAADETVVRALMLASRAFVGLTLRSLGAAAADVTLPQFRTLVVLAVRGPLRSTDIAEELGVNPSTGTRMCDRLVRKGLIDRMPDPGDRRVVRLGLTSAGRDVVGRVIAARRAELVRIVAATAGVWQPAVIDALTAFAAATGEGGEPDWWLGWSADPADGSPDRSGDPVSGDPAGGWV